MRLSLSFLFFAICGGAFSQETPLFNQYVFDPYLINPSYVGHSGYTELNLLHKIQWAGVEDGPRTSAINFQYASSPRVSLGVAAYNQDVVLLSTTSALATFGYRVPFSRRTFLSFGLSAGVLLNRIKLEDVTDVNDPVFARSDNSTRMDGEFGLNFTHQKFTVGFSLLELIDNNAFSTHPDISPVSFSNFDNMAATLGYKFGIGRDVDFSPYLLYRFTEDFDYYEVTGAFSYKDKITVGGYFRQDYGAGFLVRLRLSGRIDFGYSHEIATSQSEDYAGGSHELQFKMLFGENVLDKLASASVIIDSSATGNQVVAEEVESRQEEDVSMMDPPVVGRSDAESEPLDQRSPGARHQAVVEEDKEITSSEKDSVTVHQTSLQAENASQTRYALIIGTFKSSSNAIAFIRSARAQGVNPEMAFVRATGYYYVYLPEFSAEEPTVEYLLKIREQIPFKDAWYKLGVGDD